MRVHIRRALPVVTLAALITPALATTVAASAPPESPAPTSDALTIAQGIATLDGAELRWELTPIELAAGATSTIETGGPAFVVVSDGALLFGDGADGAAPRVRLDAFEAGYSAGGGATGNTPADEGATGLQLALVPGDGLDAFTPAAGDHEIVLHGDVLDPGEGVVVPAPATGAAFVAVVSGSVTLGSETLAAGEGTVLATQVAAANPTSTTALVVIATLAPTDEGATQATTTVAPTAPATATAPTTPATPPTTAAPTTTLATTTTMSTTPVDIPTPPDTDGDGLNDLEEASLGTDPNSPDSDGDSLSDGDEVNLYGTNPLDNDTDGDMVVDQIEIGNGTDPTDPDSDDDGYNDHDDFAPLDPNQPSPQNSAAPPPSGP